MPVDDDVCVRREDRRTKANALTTVTVDPNRACTSEHHKRRAIIILRIAGGVDACAIVEDGIPRAGRHRAIIRAALVKHTHLEVGRVALVSWHRAICNRHEVLPLKVVALTKRHTAAEVEAPS